MSWAEMFLAEMSTYFPKGRNILGWELLAAKIELPHAAWGRNFGCQKFRPHAAAAHTAVSSTMSYFAVMLCIDMFVSHF